MLIPKAGAGTVAFIDSENQTQTQAYPQVSLGCGFQGTGGGAI